MKTIYNMIVYLVASVILTISCQSKVEKQNKNEDTIALAIIQTDSKAEVLFNQKCMICHNTEGKTDATMLAPPFYQVKKRYLNASIDKNDFIETMTNWVNNPIEDNALMRGAVEKLKVMPKLGYKDEEIREIVNYIYETDMPKPDWFDAHQKSHRMENKKNGKEKGKGKGRGKAVRSPLTSYSFCVMIYTSLIIL